MISDGEIFIIEEPVLILADYATVPSAFTVRSRYILSDPGNPRMKEEPVESYVKDYDALESPAEWPERFDVSNWGVFSASIGENRVGGAIIAWKTAGLECLANAESTAVLWDLRIEPRFRGKGIGEKLFNAAIEWARQRGCSDLTIETQNVNVPACKFYARHGCKLTAINPDAYPGLNEVQMIWVREI
jgi:ribosomal protein S18 acetylase RimI-like enzyme